MFPVAGALIWIFLGGIIGVLASKVTRRNGYNAIMGNMGVGVVSALVAGFLVQLATGGEQTAVGFWIGVVVAVLAAITAVTVFRKIYPDHSPTLR
jgi:uncharacterized membrane protein YeaQ/YmgE (transglycosylase-associated protein family)